MSKIKANVYVVDDDAALCNALQLLLKGHGYTVQTFNQPKDFLEAFDEKKLGCLILDVRIPGASGLDVQEELNRKGAGLPIIILTGHADIPTAVKAIKAGAMNFLEKPFKQDVLIEQVEAAIEKHRRWLRRFSERREIAERIGRLTPREREVLELMAQGKSNKAIAEFLGISRKTLDIHRAKVMSKMEVRTVSELVRLRYVESPQLIVGAAAMC